MNTLSIPKLFRKIKNTTNSKELLNLLLNNGLASYIAHASKQEYLEKNTNIYLKSKFSMFHKPFHYFQFYSDYPYNIKSLQNEIIREMIIFTLDNIDSTTTVSQLGSIIVNLGLLGLMNQLVHQHHDLVFVSNPVNAYLARSNTMDTPIPLNQAQNIVSQVFEHKYLHKR